MDKFKCVCPCMLGVEGLVAKELKKLGAEDVEAQNGRVLFKGNSNIMARINIGSRYSERVLILLSCFQATTFEELFEGVRSIPFERWIGKKDIFPVKGSSINSKLQSVPDCQSIIKKAIVERLKSKYHISWFEETEHLYQIQFLIMKDQVSIMIDTSGQGLHKRGYRTNSTEAPIKETLAASMANLAFINKNTNLIDPFCGSGTILIESALYAMNISPGINRKFTAETWNSKIKKSFDDERKQAIELIDRNVPFEATGYDIDDNALSLTLENAKRAGVESKIKVFKRDIKDFQDNLDRCTVICNPPYGQRLLDIHQAQEIYSLMGKVFKHKKGHNYYIISPDEDFEQFFGRKSDKRRKLYNGMIKCQFHMYFK